jgi:LysM domain
MAVSSVDMGHPRARSWEARGRRSIARRRLVSIIAAGSVAVGTMLIGSSAPASRVGAPRAIVVRDGDTLWEIAGRYAPDGVDVRAYIDALVVLNDLGPTLQEGDRLRLPH